MLYWLYKSTTRLLKRIVKCHGLTRAGGMLHENRIPNPPQGAPRMGLLPPNIKKLDKKNDIPGLLKCLDHRWAWVRYRAFAALSARSDAGGKAAGRLRKMVDDPDPWVKTLAVLKFAELGDPSIAGEHERDNARGLAGRPDRPAQGGGPARSDRRQHDRTGRHGRAGGQEGAGEKPCDISRSRDPPPAPHAVRRRPAARKAPRPAHTGGAGDLRHRRRAGARTT